MSKVTIEVHTPRMACIEVAARKFGYRDSKEFIAEAAFWMARMALLSPFDPEQEEAPSETAPKTTRRKRSGARRAIRK